MKELTMYELAMMVCGSTYRGQPAEVSIYQDGLFRTEVRYRGENGSVLRKIDGSGANISACFKQCLDFMGNDCDISFGDATTPLDGIAVGCGQGVFSAALVSSPELSATYTASGDCSTIQIEGNAADVQGTFLAALDAHLNTRKCSLDISVAPVKVADVFKPV